MAVRLDSVDARTALGRAGLVICATTARETLFDSALLCDDIIVIAIEEGVLDVVARPRHR